MDSFGKSITKLTLALPPPAGGQCPGGAGIHPLVHIHSLLTSVTITALVSASGRRQEGRDKEGGEGAAWNSEGHFAPNHSPGESQLQF